MTLLVGGALSACGTDSFDAKTCGPVTYPETRTVGVVTVDKGSLSCTDARGAQSLARLIDGTWTIYSAFPTSTCNSKAKADGVPDREMSSFPAC